MLNSETKMVVGDKVCIEGAESDEGRPAGAPAIFVRPDEGCMRGHVVVVIFYDCISCPHLIQFS